jgi:hypothetical protein
MFAVKRTKIKTITIMSSNGIVDNTPPLLVLFVSNHTHTVILLPLLELLSQLIELTSYSYLAYCFLLHYLSVATTHFTYYCHPNKSLFLVGATTTT